MSVKTLLRGAYYLPTSDQVVFVRKSGVRGYNITTSTSQHTKVAASKLTGAVYLGRIDR